VFVEVCVGAMQRIGGLLCVAVQDLALRDLAQYVAVGGSMFAARCSVLLCVAACCSVLQCVAVQDLALADLAQLQRTTSKRLATNDAPASVLQCVAVCCGVLQCSKVSCSVLQCVAAHHLETFGNQCCACK